MEILKIQTFILKNLSTKYYFKLYIMKKSNNQKNKRQRYTNEQKLEVIEYKEKLPNTTVDALIIKFQMSKGTISDTLNKNIHKIKAACSENRSVKTIKGCGKS